MPTTQVHQADWFIEVDCYLFGEGYHYRIYEKLGAHLTAREGEAEVYFAVWAPHAQTVGVVGDFNSWDAQERPMQRNSMGIWQVFVPNLKSGEQYKYAITDTHGHSCLKTYPYGYQQELRPATVSIVTDLAYPWQDESWLEKRCKANLLDNPISI